MSTLTANIPVPASGDGPIVSVANIVGEKTVQLSGQFTGFYNLLASQDGTNFVAVASFDAGGPEGIRTTIAGAFTAFRLRTRAIPKTPVICEVSGVLGAGENGFGTIATIYTGFSGPTLSVDTSVFIPPSGSEEDTCFICVGAFQGEIVVEGSIDNAVWNPIGGFQIGQLLGGASVVSELPPLFVSTITRYVRLNVKSLVLGQVTVTMGGRVPATSGVVGTSIGIVTSDASVGYTFQGSAAAGAITDALGNSTAGVLQDALILGQLNTVGPTSAQITELGNNNHVGANVVSCCITGDGNSMPSNMQSCAIVGTDNHLAMAGTSGQRISNQFLFGNFNVGGGPNPNVQTSFLVMGYHNTVHTTTTAVDPSPVIIGFGNAVTGNPVGLTLIGTNWNLPNDLTHGTSNIDHSSVCMGFGGNVNGGASFYLSVIMGSPHMPAAIDYLEVIALGYTSVGGSNCVLIGECTTLGNDALAIGRDTVASTSSVVVGRFVSAASNGTYAHAIGNTIAFGQAVSHAYVFADNATISDYCLDVVVIGDSMRLLASTSGNPTQAVVSIGDHHLLTGPFVDQVVAIGSRITLPSMVSTVAIGDHIVITTGGTGYDVFIGSLLTIGSAVGLSVVMGYNVIVGDGAQCIAIGPTVSIPANSRGIAIGPGAQTTSDTHHWAIALGAAAVAGNDEFIVGASNHIEDPDSSIHHFQVQGYNGGNLNTIDAIDNPASGDIGLSIVYNAAGTYSQKTVHASASPTAGKLLLYIDP